MGGRTVSPIEVSPTLSPSPSSPLPEPPPPRSPLSLSETPSVASFPFPSPTPSLRCPPPPCIPPPPRCWPLSQPPQGILQTEPHLGEIEILDSLPAPANEADIPVPAGKGSKTPLRWGRPGWARAGSQVWGGSQAGGAGARPGPLCPPPPQPAVSGRLLWGLQLPSSLTVRKPIVLAGLSQAQGGRRREGGASQRPGLLLRAEGFTEEVLPGPPPSSGRSPRRP